MTSNPSSQLGEQVNTIMQGGPEEYTARQSDHLSRLAQQSNSGVTDNGDVIGDVMDRMGLSPDKGPEQFAGTPEPEPQQTEDQQADDSQADANLAAVQAAARNIGFSEDQIGSFGDSRSLLTAIQIVADRMQQQPAPQQTAPQPEPKPRDDKGRFAAQAEEDDGELDPVIQRKLAALDDRLSSLADENGTLKQRITEYEQRAVIGDFFSAVRGLPEKYHSFFGKNPTENMPKNSAEYINLSALSQMVGQLRSVGINTQEAVHLAASHLYGEKVESKVRDDVRGSMADRAKQHLGRGTTPAASPKNGANRMSDRDLNEAMQTIMQRLYA